MDLEKIEQVKKIVGDNAANDLLKRGWVLLDAKVVQWTKPEGGEGEGAGTIYILGKPEEDLQR